MTEFSFGQKFQDEMLALMIKDYGFALRVAKYVAEDRLYSESHKYLFGIIKSKIEKEGYVPSIVEVEDGLKYIDSAKRRILRIFIDKIYNSTPIDAEYIKDQLTEYSKKTLFVESFQNAQTIWNTGKHDDTYQFMLESMNEIFSVSYRDDINVSIEDFEEQRAKYIEDLKTVRKRIPTGIDTLDGVLSGGLAKTEMGIILGDVKIGKSIGLVHMGAHALASYSGSVAHFVLEGATEQTLMRYQSRLTGIEYRRIALDNLTSDEEDKLDNIGHKFMGNLELIPFNTRWNYTVQDIESKILEMERRGRKPDLIVVDYGDLLSVPVESGRFRMEYRHQQAEIFRGLKTIAMIFKAALWTASQVSKPKDDPAKETLLRARNIAEAYEKVRITDLLISLNQTPREKEMGLMRILIDIYRDNETDKVVKIVQDFSRMIFHNKIYGFIPYSERPTWV